MLRLMGALGTCILANALVPTVAAHAVIYYVDTTGSNSHPGTKEKPWRTVAYAVSQMVAGDTTYVRGGTYVEKVVRFSRSGTQSSPIKLLNYPGESPVIDCVDASPRVLNWIILQSASGAKFPIGWITIEGFEIKNCFQGLKAYNLHDSVIRRNWIHDSLYNGILLNGSARVLLDRNRINGNGLTDPTPPGGHGIYINGSSHIVTNNVIYNNRCYGIQLNGTMVYKSTSNPAPEFAESNNWIIANNTFGYQKGCAGLVIWGSRANNTRVENNIFYENAVDGLTFYTQGVNFISCDSRGIQIRNNLAYASGSGGTVFLGHGAAEGVHYTQSGNIVNTSDPRFVNAPATLPPSPNFALTERSPAIDKGLSPEQSSDIDKGLPLTWATLDFDGTARPKGRAHDIGAYEYSADSDSQSPTAPMALRVD